MFDSSALFLTDRLLGFLSSFLPSFKIYKLQLVDQVLKFIHVICCLNPVSGTLQGKGRTKVTDSEDKDDIDPVIPNGSKCLEVNGCENDVKEGSAVVPEDTSVEDLSEADESRPLKKPKSAGDENCSSIDNTNGQIP